MDTLKLFEKGCKALRKKYHSKPLPIKRNTTIKSITLRDEYARIAYKYFSGKRFKTDSDGNLFPSSFSYDYMIEICERMKIDFLSIVNNPKNHNTFK